MKEKVSIEEPKPEKKMSLLRRYDIPVEFLDYKHVNACTNVVEIERILRILRSGEEGHFPDLIKCTEERLQILCPTSHLLRVEKPILRPGDLEKEERESIQRDLLGWIESVETKSLCHGTNAGDIFAIDELSTENVPIRGEKVAVSNKNSQKIVSDSGDGFLKPVNPNRIKSWEYDKWDKLDVDAELTRLDIQDMQIEEWEKHGKVKYQEEQKKVELLMKNENIEEKKEKKAEKVEIPKVHDESKQLGEYCSHLTSSPRLASFNMPFMTKNRNIKESFEPQKSFIEELPMDEPEKKKQSKRRVKVVIDDVNIRI